MVISKLGDYWRKHPNSPLNCGQSNDTRHTVEVSFMPGIFRVCWVDSRREIG
jgi:hypothetical protein